MPLLADSIRQLSKPSHLKKLIGLVVGQTIREGGIESPLGASTVVMQHDRIGRDSDAGSGGEQPGGVGAVKRVDCGKFLPAQFTVLDELAPEWVKIAAKDPARFATIVDMDLKVCFSDDFDGKRLAAADSVQCVPLQ